MPSLGLLLIGCLCFYFIEIASYDVWKTVRQVLLKHTLYRMLLEEISSVVKICLEISEIVHNLLHKRPHMLTKHEITSENGCKN